MPVLGLGAPGTRAWGAVSGPAFLTSETVLSDGGTAMIALRLAQPAEAEIPTTLTSNEPKTLEVLRQPVFLIGHTLAFGRVRALRAGRVSLRCGGETLQITVTDRASALNEEARRPTFLTPSEGAFVTGTVSVAVEMFADSLRGASSGTRVELVLPSGKSLAPVEEFPAVDGPFRRFRYLLDTRALPPGSAVLIARALAPGGSRLDSVPLTVHAGDAKSAVADECENHLGTDRPQTFGESPPLVAFDAAASGSQYLTLANKRPVWRFRAAIPRDGSYQLFVQARGNPSAGSLPALRLLNIEDDRTLAGGSLAGTAWHRVPVGRAFELKAGEAVLGIELANEMNVANRAARSAELDRFELVPAPAAAAAAPPRIAFAEPFDGARITGPFQIRALVSPETPKGAPAPAPALALTANGTVIARTRQDAPGFHVDPSRLTPGVNRLRLQLLSPDGRVVAQSAEQSVSLAAPPPPRDTEKTAVLTAPGPGWSAKAGSEVKGGPGGKVAWMFAAEAAGAFAVPPEWEGGTVLELDVRGDLFEGAPVAEIELESNGVRSSVGSVTASADWRVLPAGQVYLPPGPKSIRVRFANDRAEANKGDRNLYVAGLKLRAKPVRTGLKPTVRILHPPADGTLGAADAAILDIASPAGVRTVEILLDGQPVSWAVPPPHGIGPIVAPLPLRSIPAGPHQLAAVVTDERGGRTESAPVRIQVDPGASDTRYLRAVRRLDQLAYGPEPRELARLLVEPGGAGFHVNSTPTPGEVAALQASELAHPGGDENVVILRAIAHALLTPEPARMRFVLWAENHFSTWIRKSGSAAKWNEHVAFWNRGPAPFLDLLRTSATSPAMLVYLDQHRSFAGKLNENYGRELLELHTLGVEGGYTQQDVTMLAGLLTGWTAQDEYQAAAGTKQVVGHYRYAPHLNDGQAREVLGVRWAETPPAGRYDRVCEFLELLAAHPSTARFVVRKLAMHYAGTAGASALAEELTACFLATAGDMESVIAAAADSPRMAGAPARIASPSDFAIRLCRVAGVNAAVEARDLMQRTGRAPFDRSTPDGYPEGDMLQADSNLLLQKWGLAARLGERIAQRIPRPLFQGNRLESPEGRQRLLDWTAIRLTGRALGDISNAAGARMLESKFSTPEDAAVQAAVFVAQSPEAQLR